MYRVVGDYIPTLVVSEEVKKKLDGLKEHPRETYQDVIERLMEAGS